MSEPDVYVRCVGGTFSLYESHGQWRCEYSFPPEQGTARDSIMAAALAKAMNAAGLPEHQCDEIVTGVLRAMWRKGMH